MMKKTATFENLLNNKKKGRSNNMNRRRLVLFVLWVIGITSLFTLFILYSPNPFHKKVVVVVNSNKDENQYPLINNNSFHELEMKINTYHHQNPFNINPNDQNNHFFDQQKKNLLNNNSIPHKDLNQTIAMIINPTKGIYIYIYMKHRSLYISFIVLLINVYMNNHFLNFDKYGVENDDDDDDEKKCDLFKGRWIPDLNGSLYTNWTCSMLPDSKNCGKYGRRDVDYMNWRWKPDECELPRFNPKIFLSIVRGKKLAFIGDSVARNQMESLLCLLSQVSLITTPFYFSFSCSSSFFFLVLVLVLILHVLIVPQFTV